MDRPQIKWFSGGENVINYVIQLVGESNKKSAINVGVFNARYSFGRPIKTVPFIKHFTGSEVQSATDFLIQWTLFWQLTQWVTSLFGLVFHWVFRWDHSVTVAETKHRTKPNLIQKVKWRFWFGLSESLNLNFGPKFGLSDSLSKS